MPTDPIHGAELGRLMRRCGAPGGQYVRMRRGEIECNLAIGLANAWTGEPVLPTTTFKAYSIAKVITAHAFLRLASTHPGLLGMPLAEATGMPELAAMGSIEDALRHQAGFANPFPLAWIRPASATDDRDGHLFARSLLQRHARRASRVGRYRYSNLGYLALAEAMAHLTGESYDDWIRSNLFDRLAIQGLTTHWTNQSDNHSVGHVRRFGPDGLLVRCLRHRHWLIAERAEAWLTLNHFVLEGRGFGQLSASAMALASYGCSLLTDQAAEPMFALESACAARSCAFFSSMLGQRRWFGHCGGGLGYYAELRIYPEDATVTAVMTNRSGFRDLRLLNSLDARTI